MCTSNVGTVLNINITLCNFLNLHFNLNCLSFTFFQLTDFGLSFVKGGVGSDSMMQSVCGTPIYMGRH